MSATLATIWKKLAPSTSIAIFERLDTAAAESSDAWNNAGTGHSGFCELNYTPQKPDGSVDVSKAIAIAKQFNASLDLWRFLVEHGDLPNARDFIRPVPHISFVWGDDDVRFLRARYEKLAQSSLFHDLEWSDDAHDIASWIPLVMDGGARQVPVAATRMQRGADVNFGSLTRGMIDALSRSGVDVRFSHEVLAIERDGDRWRVDVREVTTGAERTVRAKFVFIGAGGYSLTLLEKTGIPEAKAYGAFPVSGQWLKCVNRAVIEKHHAKVYGKAEVGAPPMSVPHLDSRWINGSKELLFGPYAGFTTKFLKQGSWLDLLRSVGIHNVLPVMDAGLENFDLTRYLIGQATLSVDERIAMLRKFCPTAKPDDWELQIAGLRVQVIKNENGHGVLKFGTEVVTSADRSVAALLGASPGASTAAAIMLELLATCFPTQWSAWSAARAKMFPSLAA